LIYELLNFIVQRFSKDFTDLSRFKADLFSFFN
jgi:hypothetical protein